MSLQSLLEILGIFFLSGIKFIYAPAASIALGYGFLKTFLITFSGGSAGVLFFYYFGKIINRKLINVFSSNSSKKNKEKRTKFNFRNRTIVRFKRTYGLTGLALVTPIIFSIPIGAIIAARYFKKRITPVYFVAGVLVWSLLLTSICFNLRDYFFS